MNKPRKRRKEENLSAEIEQTKTTDKELVSQAQNGNADAFERLVERYDRRVLSLAFSFTRNSDDAKDIYQDTLIRAFNSIRKFQMKSEFSTWLYRIASNVCISFKYRQKKNMDVFRQNSWRDEEGIDPETIAIDSDSVEREYMRAELAKQIESALGALSPMQRLVFTMKHYEGYLLREIAFLTNCTEGTVKKHLYVAVRRLQDELRGALE
ncbi:MAG: RNA polymerase sigma factor [Candidatus Kryptoniota bacterium]